MDDLIKAVKKMKSIEEEISKRLEKWSGTKETLQENLTKIGQETALDHEILVTDHIKNWESVSLKIKDEVFSYYVKGNKKQPIVKQGAYLVYGVMPSGFIKAGMVFPKINDIKEKEISFMQFDLIRDPGELNEDLIRKHVIRFIHEINQWELGEGGEIRERIGFKMSK